MESIQAPHTNNTIVDDEIQITTNAKEIKHCTTPKSKDISSETWDAISKPTGATDKTVAEPQLEERQQSATRPRDDNVETEGQEQVSLTEVHRAVLEAPREFYDDANVIHEVEMKDFMSRRRRAPVRRVYRHMIPKDTSCFSKLFALPPTYVLSPEEIIGIHPGLKLEDVESIAKFYEVTKLHVARVMEFFALLKSIHPSNGWRTLIQKVNNVIRASVGKETLTRELLKEFTDELKNDIEGEQPSEEVSDFLETFRILHRLCAINGVNFTSFVNYALDKSVAEQGNPRITKLLNYFAPNPVINHPFRAPVKDQVIKNVAEFLPTSDLLTLRTTTSDFRRVLSMNYFEQVMARRGNFNVRHLPDIISHSLQLNPTKHPPEFAVWNKEILEGRRSGWSEKECFQVLVWLVKYQRDKPRVTWPELNLHDVFWLQFMGFFGIAKDYMDHLVNDICDGDCSQVYDAYMECVWEFPEHVKSVQNQNPKRRSPPFNLPDEVLAKVTLFRMIAVNGHDVVIGELGMALKSEEEFVASLKRDQKKVGEWRATQKGKEFVETVRKCLNLWIKKTARVNAKDVPKFIKPFCPD